MGSEQTPYQKCIAFLQDVYLVNLLTFFRISGFLLFLSFCQSYYFQYYECNVTWVTTACSIRKYTFMPFLDSCSLCMDFCQCFNDTQYMVGHQCNTETKWDTCFFELHSALKASLWLLTNRLIHNFLISGCL
jgi:hypothetical protein